MTDLTEKRRPWKGLGNQLLQKTKSVRRQEKYSLGRTIGFNEVQTTRGFDKLRAVFKKHSPPPLPRTELSTCVKVASPLLPVRYPR
jgi:hypothetical protein